MTSEGRKSGTLGLHSASVTTCVSHAPPKDAAVPFACFLGRENGQRCVCGSYMNKGHLWKNIFKGLLCVGQSVKY